MSYQTDIEIDEQALDIEWLDHARRMLNYTTNAADANREMELAKENRDFIRAQLDQRVRTDPSEYGISRVTESSVQSAILAHPDYRAAATEYIQRKYEYEVAIGVVRAFEHRKSALENLVRLHNQSYFAGPAVPHNLAAEKAARANRHVRIMRREN